MEGDTQFSDDLRRLSDEEKGALAREALGTLDTDAKVALARELLDGTDFKVEPITSVATSPVSSRY